MLSEHVGNEYSLLIPGPPKSVNARSKKSRKNLDAYKRGIEKEASKIFEKPVRGKVEVSIHFHNGTTTDLGNVQKPIIDSLIGTAYEDDGQIESINLKRISLGNPRRIKNVTSSLIPEALVRKKECVVIIINQINEERWDGKTDRQRENNT